MQTHVHPGSTLVIKGVITAQESLSIAGRVDGSIDAQGQMVTIYPGALVAADIAAAAIVIGGTVRGSVAAERRIELHAGAEVSGDLSAPGASVEDGAVLHGVVHLKGTDRAPVLA
jgi:cytoskeletal protein CcmA (bactofilin family)